LSQRIDEASEEDDGSLLKEASDRLDMNMVTGW